MSVNTMSVQDAHIILNDMAKQITGEDTITSVDTASFVSLAQKLIQEGYDPLLGALRQTMTRSIFSERNYDPKLRGVQTDNARFGAYTRKINYLDNDFEVNPAYTLEDGDFTPDMFSINKPKVFETTFYGMNTYKRHYTMFRQALDNALRSPEEFAAFYSGVAQNNANVIKQSWESAVRILIANLVAGKVAKNSEDSIIHVLTEYNEACGLQLTQEEARQPQNFKAICQWLYARINNLSDLMEERSQLFQEQVEGFELNRHTPKEYQRIYFNSQFLNEMSARAVADTYHDSFLKADVTEGVTFWQNIKDPYKIIAKPSYMDSNGQVVESEAEVTVDNVIGVIFDRDCLAMSVFDEYSSQTPYESRGDYWNLWWSWTVRWAEDMTEKAIVILFD